MANTLLLDTQLWDLCLDVHGDIAMAQTPYAVAQDVASAIKLFRGELWYDTRKGIPYFGQILGKTPPIAFMKARFIAAAKSVPLVASAVCYIGSIVGRQVSGQVQITDEAGVTTVVGF